MKNNSKYYTWWWVRSLLFQYYIRCVGDVLSDGEETLAASGISGLWKGLKDGYK